MKDRGPIPIYQGHDEVDIFRELSRELSEAMDQWEVFDSKGLYDKVLWGFGGPILAERKLKIQRFPFITPEMVMSAAHTYPVEILKALDTWTWDRIRRARSVHFVDPEGTDLWYTARDEYFDSRRDYYNEEHVHRWWPQNEASNRFMIAHHFWGKPSFLLPPGLEDGHGVIAGSMATIVRQPPSTRHRAPRLITEIEGGGTF